MARISGSFKHSIYGREVRIKKKSAVVKFKSISDIVQFTMETPKLFLKQKIIILVCL